jgi:uncharacterized protein YbjT (DUF2867 family)
MKVLIFGATGMVGQGVLRECLRDAGVELLQTVGRSATAMKDAKVREVMHSDLLDIGAIAEQLAGFDACFFCLGVTSNGMTEEDYRRVTYGITLAVAEVLARLNPQLTFVYVSGAGTDSSEQGRSMWARVKGATENALLRLPFAAAYMFRPGIIEPLYGIKSRTRLYQIFYTLGGPLLPLLRMAFPNQVLTTEQIGLAMLAVARRGYAKSVLETRDIRQAAGG